MWLGNASSNLADGVTFVALPLLATTLTSSPLAISALAIAYSTPRALSVLGVGVLIDRAGRRRLLHLANFSRAAMFALLTTLVITDATSLAALYAVYAVMGVVETVSDGAASAVLPQVVGPRDLDRANAQIAGTQTVLDEFVGPPLGGFLFALAAFAPSAVTAAAFVVAALAYVRLRGSYAVAPSEDQRSRAGVLASIREGAAWTWHHRLVRLLVLYATVELGLSPAGYGLLLSFSALGGLAGALIAARLRRRLGYGWTIVAALTVGALSFFVLSLTTHLVVVSIALATYTAHAVVWSVMASSVRQRATPAAIMGRAGSVARLLSLSGLAAGAAAGGLLASSFGYRVPFAVAGALFAVAALACALQVGLFRTWEDDQDTMAAGTG